MKIPFFQPYITGNELVYMKDIIDHRKDMAGDGEYTKKVHALLESRYGTSKALLTTSGTTALEMAVRLLDLQTDDEVIVPSFTFSSTANAVLMKCGLKVRFADISERTLNIDIADLERRITPKTKAVIAVHYAGVACDMDALMAIARTHGLRVIEDAAQGIEATYKGKYLGTIGDFGCLSFHDTKNITCGEGGAVFINSGNPAIHEAAEIIREKGTNRSKFFRGLVDKYTWVDIGSSYLPSDLLAAYLFAQLEQAGNITALRRRIYDRYMEYLRPLADAGYFRLPEIPDFAGHNAHIFYVLFPAGDKRDDVLADLRNRGIGASFHYIPLHSSPQGRRAAAGDCPVTESVSARLLRLPLYAAMTEAEQDFVITSVRTVLTGQQKGSL